MIDVLRNCPTAIFDCDGVILQSNKLKSDAFGDVLRAHDPELVEKFVNWHRRTGGVSRFEKFAVFFRDMLDVPDWEDRTDVACQAFGDRVFNLLCDCPTIPGVKELLEFFIKRETPLCVNTGGAEQEIRSVFQHRGMSSYFSEIFGSPSTKLENMEKIKSLNLLKEGSVYFGDSELDFELAKAYGLEFIFIEYESEWQAGRRVSTEAGYTALDDFTDVFK